MIIINTKSPLWAFLIFAIRNFKINVKHFNFMNFEIMKICLQESQVTKGFSVDLMTAIY